MASRIDNLQQLTEQIRELKRNIERNEARIQPEYEAHDYDSVEEMRKIQGLNRALREEIAFDQARLARAEADLEASQIPPDKAQWFESQMGILEHLAMQFASATQQAETALSALNDQAALIRQAGWCAETGKQSPLDFSIGRLVTGGGSSFDSVVATRTPGDWKNQVCLMNLSTYKSRESMCKYNGAPLSLRILQPQE